LDACPTWPQCKIQVVRFILLAAALSLAGARADDPPAYPDAVGTAVQRLSRDSIPVKQRLAEIAHLARAGDDAGARTLMLLGDRRTYLNWAAVEALAEVPSPRVAEYLDRKLDDADARVVCAAIGSFARVRGMHALPRLAAVLKANRKRSDGHEDVVCTAAVEALAGIGSPEAIPILASELRETVGSSLHYEYGSRIVGALRTIGNPAAVPALRTYIEALADEHARNADNPLGQTYIEEKIDEAREAIDALGEQ
jgi:HEAT repeat protein